MKIYGRRSWFISVTANFKYERKVSVVTQHLHTALNTGLNPVHLRSWLLNLMFSKNLFSENFFLFN